MAETHPHQILITHPGRQHSHQAALGLHQAGMLAGYWSGVPAIDRQGFVPRRAWARYEPVALPAGLTHAAPWTPALRRLGGRLPRRMAAQVDFLACRLFDRWAAARLRATAATAVIACEISALSTFRRARRCGMTTILDAPSIHHLEQDRVQPTLDSPALHRRIARVKDREIAAADLILTVSELARESYLAHGAPAERVHALTLGADPVLFGAEGSGSPPEDGVVFVFAGAAIQRKGFDLLLDAFRATREHHGGVRLRIVGPSGECTPLARDVSGVELVGALDQKDLAAELRRAHCLVLPSRHDSFGMVVVEALAAGTPVVVSRMVGAKDLVEEGRTGWVVDLAAPGALAARLEWCAEHARDLLGMRPSCRLAAARCSWEAYHAQLAARLGMALSELPATGRALASGAVLA